MAYLVNLAARAERDLAYLYHEINAVRSDTALKRYRGLKKAILSLEEHPNRCPATVRIKASGICCKLVELAQERPRFGYRRLQVLLRREGIEVNHKRVWRIYREAGLAVKRMIGDN